MLFKNIDACGRVNNQEPRFFTTRDKVPIYNVKNNKGRWSSVAAGGTYLLAVLQDALLGADAGLGPRWIGLPLPILHIHVHVQFAAKHGDLGFRKQAGIAISGHLEK